MSNGRPRPADLIIVAWLTAVGQWVHVNISAAQAVRPIITRTISTTPRAA